MDLDLSDVEVAPIITCNIEGILEPSDIAALASGALAADAFDADAEAADIQAGLAKSDDPANLKKLRDRHHSVARLTASGLSQTLVAELAGYTPSYVSVLLNNPAMQELVDLYRVQYGSTAMVIGEKLRTVGMKALEKLSDQLDRDKIDDPHALTGIAKLGLDRSGHGPSTTTHNVTESHIIDHARIKELNEAAKAQSREFIVPVREVRDALRLEAPDAND